ncbi:hypothetical protein RJ640_004809 [Escallonia rubra]|uniref:FRIGIDA-like protein n=1 Tax=Escallonia rubra TaxID=112253 RepID=A0AA88RKP7_9ASTE|nr:hypothetical protein RJ640_004809 [Escallonia rubra]
MSTVKTISAALKLVDSKKENLRKAFEELQSHSSSLSSFPLTWPDLDAHFTSLQSHLEHQFTLLQQTLDSQPPEQPQPSKPPQPAVTVNHSSNNSSQPVPVRARDELRSLCEKTDGLGLRRFIVERPKERAKIRAELRDALLKCPNVVSMVLDAMEGFWTGKDTEDGDDDAEVRLLRRVCVLLLEELSGLRAEIGSEVRERAMKLAVEWKGKMSASRKVIAVEALGFLRLLAVFGLVYGFNVDEILDYVVVLTKYEQSSELCRVLNLGDRIPGEALGVDLIPKLISNSKTLMAVKFVFEYGMADKFPPAPLLKAYIKEIEDLCEEIRKSGKNSCEALNEAARREISALKSVIKCSEDYKLESDYFKDTLGKRIQKLEKETANRKRAAAPPTLKPRQQVKSQNQNKNKHPRTAVAGPSTIRTSVAANSTVPTLQQTHIPMAGLLPDRPAPYLTSSPGPYGLAVSNSNSAPYSGSSADLYGLSGAPLGYSANLVLSGSNQHPSESHLASGYYSALSGAGYSGNLAPSGSNQHPSESLMASGYYNGLSVAPLGYSTNLAPSGSNQHPSESHVASGYYDRPVASGGYGLLSQYRPSYYPQ